MHPSFDFLFFLARDTEQMAYSGFSTGDPARVKRKHLFAAVADARAAEAKLLASIEDHCHVLKTGFPCGTGGGVGLQFRSCGHKSAHRDPMLRDQVA